jgi:sugar phosphate isomerase/epimerase
VNRSLASHMTAGILMPAAFPLAPACTAASISALERVVCDPFFGFVEVDIPTHCLAETRAATRQRDVVLDVDAGGALYASGASLCSLDPASRERALRIARAAIDAAAALGARCVSLVSGRDPGANERQAGLDALVASILALYRYARAAGKVDLALKMADRSVDKCFLIGPTNDGVAVARRVRSRYPGFGLVLNLGHLPLLDEDPEVAARLSAPYLARVDVSNCITGAADTHPRFGAPGGLIDVTRLTSFLRALLSIGYIAEGRRNIVAFEVRPTLDEEPFAVIADSKQTLCDAWAAV